jgi:hypothetical protein
VAGPNQAQYNTSMAKKPPTLIGTDLPRWYRGAEVPMSAIRQYAREVARRFGPDKIILFGSHAYGKPHADSDVDILVVMPARNRRALSTGSHCPHAEVARLAGEGRGLVPARDHQQGQGPV